MIRLAVQFERFGPYHHARLHALQPLFELTAIELSALDETYAWDTVKGTVPYQKRTLFHDRAVVHEHSGEIIRRIEAVLEEVRPEAVAISGWADCATLGTLRWCIRNRVPAIIMSESTAADAKRRLWTEAMKRRILALYRAALVGGRPHADYLAELGVSRQRIFVGYDAVDNDYFQHEADAVRKQAPEMRQRLGLPRRYFLASNRFILKKNLPFLFRAYAEYRALAGREPWQLVLMGDGILRPQLSRLREEMGLEKHILMPGFIQYGELPAYYGLAGAFIHASTTEQWGLVVNEAMASGLPVLVSDRCGCAPDLVQDGRNGFRFNPENSKELAQRMLDLTRSEDRLAEMGQASREIIAGWSPARFAEGLQQAVQAAIVAPPAKLGVLNNLLLSSLIHNRSWSWFVKKDY